MTIRQKTNGNQPGSTISTESSLRLDAVIKQAITGKIAKKGYITIADRAGSLLTEFLNQYPNLSYKHKLEKWEIPSGKGACQPDGGIFYLDDLPFFAIEGKTQGPGGNAIERYTTNREILRDRSPALSHVCFCGGEGTNPGGPIDLLVLQELAKENPDNRGWNRFHFGGSSFYKVNEYAVSVDDIKEIIRPLLHGAISNLKLIEDEMKELRLLQESTKRIHAIMAQRTSYGTKDRASFELF